MLISKTAITRWSNSNRKYYESSGRVYTKNGNELEVRDEDLTCGSSYVVDWNCDCCGTTRRCAHKEYLQRVKDGKRYCHRCATRMKSAQKKITDAKNTR